MTFCWAIIDKNKAYLRIQIPREMTRHETSDIIQNENRYLICTTSVSECPLLSTKKEGE